MDIDYTFHTNQYKTDDICLITAPRFYFAPSIETWYLDGVGDHLCKELLHSDKKYIALYMYHTEDGSDDEHVNKVLDFIKNHAKNSTEPFLTFSQCVSCNRIGTVGECFENFNFIIMLYGEATNKCHDCTFT